MLLQCFRSVGWCGAGEKDERRNTSSECPMGSLLASQLQAVMQEGLLDSLLPYLTQDKILYKPQDLSSEADPAGAAAFFPLSSLSRCSRSSDMKSRQNSSARLSRELTKEDKLVRNLVENKREIVIHVCDENRGAKKDFTCPQGLLMEKMEYFREITDGQVELLLFNLLTRES